MATPASSLTPPRAEPVVVTARAVCLGERIETRGLAGERLVQAPLVLRAGGAGFAVVFRYGCVVLFGLGEREVDVWLGQLGDAVVGRFEVPETEAAELWVAEAASADTTRLWVPNLAVETLQVVAEVLAKSVALAHYEAAIAQVFDRIEPLAAELERRGRVAPRARDLVRHIASALLVQQRMIGRVAVGESPELLWEHPSLERLHARLSDEYEIRERDLALERKLELVARTAEVLLDLLQNRRSLRVEWYIVILIVVEILLTLYQMLTAA